jgi:hypothetical protein
MARALSGKDYPDDGDMATAKNSLMLRDERSE